MLTQSRARGLFLDRSFRQMDNVAVLNSVRDRLPLLETVIYMDEWDTFLADATTAMLPEVSPDSPALILFTSGSTGKPKAAVLHHAGIVNNAALTARQSGDSSVQRLAQRVADVPYRRQQHDDARLYRQHGHTGAVA